MKTLKLLGLLCSVLFAGTALGAPLTIDLSAGHSRLVAQRRTTLPLRILLEGGPLAAARQRADVNVCVVLDRSGSMTGQKLAYAKQAALAALDRLTPNDIFSLVSYSDTAQIIVPATKVSDKYSLRRLISNIYAGGSTALFSGVSLGASEVRKFKSVDTINRVILLSDGIANVGPSSSSELGSLGSSLSREGISVSTIGVGSDFNEDLMTELANRSEGNAAFVESPTSLAWVFDKEFGDIFSVVARDIDVKITFADGIRPIRVLAKDASIFGQTIAFSISQIYAKQGKYVVIEAEASPRHAGETLTIASARVTYREASSGDKAVARSKEQIYVVASEADAAASANASVMEAYYTQLANESSLRALELRDQGRIAEAKSTFAQIGEMLAEKAARYNSEQLRQEATYQREQTQNLDQMDWNTQRKMLKFDNLGKANQQGYDASILGQ